MAEIITEINFCENKSRTRELSANLANMMNRLELEKLSLIVILEGYDASGKSGCASRIVRCMDAKDYKVCHTSAPTDEELRYCYLKRFWDNIPPAGKLTIFDRSWYGRVLVERVDGFCTEEEWCRAYGEIRDFERYLAMNGAIILKFWLDISEEEQLDRFLKRWDDPAKRHKITDDDWLNRSKRELYDEALYDMLNFTDTEWARWDVIPADNKKAARTAILERITEAVSEALNLRENQ